MSPVEVSRRRFKSPYWDVPPTGFEHVTPVEYKEMQKLNQVPQTVVNPSSQHLQGTKFARPRVSDPMEAVRAAAAIINATLLSSRSSSTNLLSGVAKTAANGSGPNRQARRLYVGNIPIGTSDGELIEFMRSNLESRNCIFEPGNPVVACQINLDKNFAFLEFRSVEETTSAMALDGIQCKGQPLKIRRPHDYQSASGANTASIGSSSTTTTTTATTLLPQSSMLPTPNQGNVSTVVADSQNKIYIGGLPTYLTDEPIKEILSSFGTLKAFNLIRDPVTLASKGYAFCEYLDSTITESAILGLNGFEIGEKKLIVQRASVGAKTGTLSATGAGGIATTSTPMGPALIGAAPVQIQVPGMPKMKAVPRVLTEVLCLMNMVEPDELRDDNEYDDIIQDIRDECGKWGTVKSIHIPRPARDNNQTVPGLGKVFVEFDSATQAQRAQMSIAGRRFANRVVVTSYFDRDRYKNRDF